MVREQPQQAAAWPAWQLTAGGSRQTQEHPTHQPCPVQHLHNTSSSSGGSSSDLVGLRTVPGSLHELFINWGTWAAMAASCGQLLPVVMPAGTQPTRWPSQRLGALQRHSLAKHNIHPMTTTFSPAALSAAATCAASNNAAMPSALATAFAHPSDTSLAKDAAAEPSAAARPG